MTPEELDQVPWPDESQAPDKAANMFPTGPKPRRRKEKARKRPLPKRFELYLEVAAMELRACSLIEIRERFELSKDQLSHIRCNYDYRAVKAKLATDLAAGVTFDLIAEVGKLGKKVYDRKVALMEQDSNLLVANQAADSFLDRLYPKKTEHQEHKTVRVSVTVERAAALKQILDEDTIDVTPAEVSDG